MVDRNVRDLTTATAYDSNGDKLGSVKEVYLNDATGQPDFVEVGHGLFGMSSSLVPLRGHRLEGDELRLAFSKDRIKDAPNVDADAHLSPEEQETIYRHYGLEGTENVEAYEPHPYVGGDRPGVDVDDARMRETGNDPYVAGAGADVGQRTGDRVGNESDELIRSEEHLKVDKDRVNTGHARLRKYVVHDTETVEVPVEREEVRIERTPVDPDDPAVRNADLADDEASVTLHEDRVNVSKEAKPVEKVRLEKDTVRDTERVTEDVAKEKIETEGGAVHDETGPRTHQGKSPRNR